MPSKQSNGIRNLCGIAPFFLVPDVVKSAEFYRDTLGFSFEDFWGEPPEFVMVKRDGIIIMLRQADNPEQVRPNVADSALALDAYLWVNDADALYAEFTAKGVRVIHEPCVTFYDIKEFTIVDCNGFALAFGQDVDRKSVV